MRTWRRCRCKTVLQLVQGRLPDAVQNSGLTVAKSGAGFFMIVSFMSTDGKQTVNDLADFIDNSLNDALRRVPGDQRHAAVRLALCHAYLARSGQTGKISADRQRRH